MKRPLLWIAVAVAALVSLPLVLLPAAGEGAAFSGSDGQAQAAIRQIAPDYEPWFSPLVEPASGEVESLLFALQAALGAGGIGYWLGLAHGRRQGAAASPAQPAAAACPASTPGAGDVTPAGGTACDAD